MAEPAIKATFTGDGSEFYAGIPARDLTTDDWALLTEEQQATVTASPLYTVAGTRRRTTTTETPAETGDEPEPPA